MSFPESPDETDIKRLFARQEALEAQIAAQTAALNGLGANVQWVIDHAKGIFEMFGNPQFMAQLPAMPSGGIPGAGPQE